MTSQRVRVVIVDDSLVQRAALVSILEADGDIKVVGQATTAIDALDAVERHKPDVLAVDLQIAEGGGQFVIEQVMARTPTPILVLSAAMKDERSTAALEALVGGALVALPKPPRWTPVDEAQLRRTIRTINRVAVIRHPRGRLKPSVAAEPPSGPRHPIVGIAASTGGPAALAKVLVNLTGLAAPVMVVQHLHPDFTEGLATWMGRVSALPVEIAKHDQALVAGHVYIGPGDVHLRLGNGMRVELSPLPESLHRPSADEMFSSLAKHAGPDAIGVILSGMGDDGTRGLLAIQRRGGRTFGQDESTCAVFGMPRAAARIGAVRDLMPPEAIAAAIRRLASEVSA